MGGFRGNEHSTVQAPMAWRKCHWSRVSYNSKIDVWEQFIPERMRPVSKTRTQGRRMKRSTLGFIGALFLQNPPRPMNTHIWPGWRGFCVFLYKATASRVSTPSPRSFRFPPLFNQPYPEKMVLCPGVCVRSASELGLSIQTTYIYWHPASMRRVLDFRFGLDHRFFLTIVLFWEELVLAC